MKKKRTRAKSGELYNETDLAPDRRISREKAIPIHELDDWIGHVKNHMKTDAIHLWGDHFRINVWCEHEVENCLYPKVSIDKSFHVVYNSGKFEDRSKPERKFETKYL